MPQGPGFAWDHERLTDRENRMLAALLELFVMAYVVESKTAHGRTNAIPQDASIAMQQAVEWANRLFPDVNVRIALP